jgi:hypothetical protein
MKNLLKLTLLAAVVVVVATLISCSDAEKGKGGGGGSGLASIKSSNMVGAKALFRTGGAALSRAEEDADEPRFWQLGVDDQVKSVVFTDQDANVVPAVVNEVKNLSTKYAVMSVSSPDELQVEYYFIIRKSDGVLTWDLGEQVLHNLFGWQDWQRFYDDASGNVYFGTDNGIFRISEQSGQTVVAPFAGNNLIEYWWINETGDVMVMAEGCYKADGTVIDLPLDFFNGSGDISVGGFFTVNGLPGSFLRIESDSQSNENWIVKYTPATDDMTREVLYEFAQYYSTIPMAATVAGYGVVLPDGSQEIFVVSGDTAPQAYTVDNNIFSFDPKANGVAMSDKYLYSMNPYIVPKRISRFDPATGEYVSNYFAWPAAEYEMQHMTASNSGIMTALVKKENTQMFIEIDAAGKITEHETYDGSPITFYERLD